jgi:hypothetical protein
MTLARRVKDLTREVSSPLTVNVVFQMALLR